MFCCRWSPGWPTTQKQWPGSCCCKRERWVDAGAAACCAQKPLAGSDLNLKEQQNTQCSQWSKVNFIGNSFIYTYAKIVTLQVHEPGKLCGWYNYQDLSVATWLKIFFKHFIALVLISLYYWGRNFVCHDNNELYWIKIFSGLKKSCFIQGFCSKPLMANSQHNIYVCEWKKHISSKTRGFLRHLLLVFYVILYIE